MKDRIIAVFPEIEWIGDEKLKAGVIATFQQALEMGGWQPEDLKEIPFTLLIPDCPASLVTHTRAITRMAKHCCEEYNEMYKGEGDFTLDFDLLIAGALLHDVGKIVEYESKDGKVVKSQLGKDLRHPFSGAALAMNNGLPSSVSHIIAVHAGEGDGRHRSPEAVVVNRLDFLNFHSIKSALGLL